jgi:hypothetical protein
MFFCVVLAPETELNKVHFEKMDLETQLMAKITSLESQLMSVNETKTQEKELLEQQIVSKLC